MLLPKLSPVCKALACVAALYCLCFAAGAQTLRVGKSVYLKQTEETYNPDVYYSFKNINRTRYYVNKELRKKIQQAEKSGDLLNLELYLGDYIKNFGIENFRQDKDLDYIWKLGQLKELRRDTARALFLYGIALKNQSRNSSKIKLQYDELKARTHNDYVELDYYYKIVSARRRIDTLVPPKGVLLNMGRKINSDAPDYAPYMHPSGSVLLFTSRRPAKRLEPILPNDENEDLYYVKANITGEGWEEAERFGDQINSPYNEGSACLNKEGTVLYFTRCNAPDVLGVCDIYQAEFMNGQWTNVKNLGPNVNSADWDSHPSLSPDGKLLFFSSNRADGFGRTDIWVSQQNDKGEWGRAKNLGPVINTIEDEVTPFVHPINNTLYFSSTGHFQNFGGFDIYKSRNRSGKWEEPRNLGPLVNTKGDEYYFTIDGKGDRLFYAAARREDPRNLDLYSFTLPMNARPDATMRLSGYLIDSISGQPLTGIVVAIDMDKGLEVPPIYINKFGYFEFSLVANRKYMVLIVGDNNVNIKDESILSADTLTKIFIKSVEMGKRVVFEKLQFKSGSAEIDTSIIGRLRSIADFLRAHPYCKLAIHGHTDADGDKDYNLTLSEARADKIRDYVLKRSGLPDSMVRSTGYGESKPIYPNDNIKHKAKNRRVEFEIVVPEKYRNYLLEGGVPPVEEVTTDKGAVVVTSPSAAPPGVVLTAPVKDDDLDALTDDEPDMTDDEPTKLDEATGDVTLEEMDDDDDLTGVIVDLEAEEKDKADTDMELEDDDAMPDEDPKR